MGAVAERDREGGKVVDKKEGGSKEAEAKGKGKRWGLW